MKTTTYIVTVTVPEDTTEDEMFNTVDIGLGSFGDQNGRHRHSEVVSVQEIKIGEEE